MPENKEKVTCKDCLEKDEKIELAMILLNKMTDRVNNASQAVKILNLKVKEQEIVISRLNANFVKVSQINKMQGKLIN